MTFIYICVCAFYLLYVVVCWETRKHGKTKTLRTFLSHLSVLMCAIAWVTASLTFGPQVKGQFNMRELKSTRKTSIARQPHFRDVQQHLLHHTNLYTYSTIIGVVMWTFFPHYDSVTRNHPFAPDDVQHLEVFERLLFWLVGWAVGVIINPVMCVFCVKVYCVAKFCSPFPGNGRKAERNKTERVTIKTIFLKNNIGERGEAETGETHSCAFPLWPDHN